jgi:hypothetical protein
MLIAIIVLALIALAVVDWLVLRRTHRLSARPRHEIPRPFLFVLKPIFRHDRHRDAWVLRIVGKQLGPVLRPHGYRGTPRGPQTIDAEAVITAARLEKKAKAKAKKPKHAPDPFVVPAMPKRKRPRREPSVSSNGNGSKPHDPPLTTRHPQD